MSSEASFSFTTKVNGNDLFTVRGETYDEFLKNLTYAYNMTGVAMVVDTLNGINETQAIAQVQQVLGEPIAATVAPAFAVTAPIPTTPPSAGKVCQHGQMAARQGTGKDGKVWRGYMCPAPQGATDKCKNIYIYPNQPEWHTFVAS